MHDTITPQKYPIEQHAQLQASLRLHHEPGLSAYRAAKLIEVFTEPTAIFNASLTKLCSILPQKLAIQLLAPPSKEVLCALEKALDWSTKADCHLVPWSDNHYPNALKNMSDPPVLLYVKGNINCLSRSMVGIVGTRDASSYGLEMAHRLAHDMAHAGWCVVSGLAKGIDAAAHRGAMTGASQGASLAVLGHGLNLVYPSENISLAQSLLENRCALVSELNPDTPPRPHQFPRRNRIVAGLVRGVIVVEAAKRSGSLITARLANELGRDVFSVPGPITSPGSSGVHALIKQGACLVESAHDVLAEFGCETSPEVAQPLYQATRQASIAHLSLSPIQKQLLDLIGHAPTQTAQLLTHTLLSPQALNIQLTMLELEGFIAREANGLVYVTSSVK